MSFPHFIPSSTSTSFLTTFSHPYPHAAPDRFGYSRDYLDRLVASTLVPKGFSVVVNNEFSPRLDAGTAVPGYLYILERKA